MPINSINEKESKNKITFSEEKVSEKENEEIEKIKQENKEIEKIKQEKEKQEEKMSKQAEIMKYFYEHPDENILLDIQSWRDSNGNEVIRLVNVKINNPEFMWFKNNIKELKIRGDNDWKVTKELVIDKRTWKRWILLINKKDFKLDKVEFEDIRKIDFPYETHFVYKENWQVFVEFIKEGNIKLNFNDKNMEMEIDGMNIHDIKQMGEDYNLFIEKLKDQLKKAKEEWKLEEYIDNIYEHYLSIVPDEFKQFVRSNEENLKSELRKLVNV